MAGDRGRPDVDGDAVAHVRRSPARSRPPAARSCDRHRDRALARGERRLEVRKHWRRTRVAKRPVVLRRDRGGQRRRRPLRLVAEPSDRDLDVAEGERAGRPSWVGGRGPCARPGGAPGWPDGTSTTTSPHTAAAHPSRCPGRRAGHPGSRSRSTPVRRARRRSTVMPHLANDPVLGITWQRPQIPRPPQTVSRSTPMRRAASSTVVPCVHRAGRAPTG